MKKVRQGRLSVVVILPLVLAAVVFPSISPRYPSARSVKATPRSHKSTSALTPVSQGKGRPPCKSCPPPILRKIYVPAIELPEARTCEIVLNSRSPNPIEVTPIFYTETGEQVVGKPLTLQSAEIRFARVDSLIPRHERNRHWGGMALSYVGGNLEVWAQITFHDVEGTGSIDETFNILGDQPSDTREAVWWMPKRSTAVLALGNSSDEPLQVTASFADGEAKQIEIAPFATEFIRRRAANGQGGNVDSVKLVTTSGSADAFRVAGFIMGGAKSFDSSIRFADTKKVAQPNLYATNLRLKNTEPRMVLKNTGLADISARPRFFSGAGENEKPVELPQITLRPSEIVDVDLTTLKQAFAARVDLDSVSLNVVSSGAPGNLIGAWYSMDKVNLLNYDVPLRDSGPIRNSTGSYPWRTDQDYTTIVNITNISDHPATFHVDIRFPGGHYYLPDRELAAFASATFDLRKIINEQKPDNQGNVIPLSATGGQFHWSLFRSPPESKFIGRSEVISVSNRVASSYSCPGCCPDSGPWGSFNPTNPVRLGNGFTASTSGVIYDGCTGIATNIGWFSMEFWMDNEAIASYYPGSGGSTAVQSLSPGETVLHGSWYWDNWESDGWSMCWETRGESEDQQPVQVFEVKILRNGSDITNTTTNVIVGQKMELVMQVLPEDDLAEGIQWTVPGTRLANYVANSSTGTVTPLSNLTDASVTYYWVDGADGRQVTLSLTVFGMPVTNTATFNVKRPTASITTSTGSVVVGTGWGDTEMSFGADPSHHGIDFSRSITIPSGFSGSTQYVQIATPFHRRQLNSGAWERFTGSGLDTTYPYGDLSPGVTADSPAEHLNSALLQASADDTFEMWLMFQPTGTGSIWVPLRKVTWSWSGTTSRSGITWTLNSSSHSTNPSDADSTTHPQWTRNTSSNNYVPE